MFLSRAVLISLLLVLTAGCLNDLVTPEPGEITAVVKPDVIIGGDEVSLVIINEGDDLVELSDCRYSMQRYERGEWNNINLYVAMRCRGITIDPEQMWSQTIHSPAFAGRYRVIKKYDCVNGDEHKITSEFTVVRDRFDWSQIELVTDPDLDIRIKAERLNLQRLTIDVDNNGLQPVTYAPGYHLFRKTPARWVLVPHDNVYAGGGRTIEPGGRGGSEGTMPQQSGTYRAKLVFSYGSEFTPPLYALAVQFDVVPVYTIPQALFPRSPQ